MSNWNHDPFSTPESDPEFGLMPKPRIQHLLISYLGLSFDYRSPIMKLRELGLQKRISAAQRELRKLHLQEQQRLLTEAARIVSHQNQNAAQRKRARAMWPGPLLTTREWRAQCREELVCVRAEHDWRQRMPRILRRMFRQELVDWPSSGDLLRAALNLSDSVPLDLEVVRAAFVEDCDENLAATLAELWSRAEISPALRNTLLRSLAVLHEAAGDAEKALTCWKLIVGRDRDHLLALLSRFSLAVSMADGTEAHLAGRAIERCVRRCDAERTALARAIRERKWIGHVAIVPIAEKACSLRLDLLASGQPLLSELCMELA